MRELYALKKGRDVAENISPELPSLTTGGNFESRAKLRGLISQEELLSAQHTSSLAEVLRQSFWHPAGLCREQSWLLPAARVDKPRLSPGSQCLHVVSLHFSVTAFQCEPFEAPRVHPPPLQGIPLPHSVICTAELLWTLSAVLHVCTFPRKVPHSWLEPSQPPPALGTHLLSIVFQAY